MRSRIISVLMGAVACPAAATAQQPPDRYICEVRQIGGRDSLTLEFVHDRASDVAFMIGNNGTSPVLSYTGRSAVSFVELVPSGVVQTTSIDQAGNAVHSRHTLSDTFIQSQWVGRCRRG
jgi:hypothetical protein